MKLLNGVNVNSIISIIEMKQYKQIFFVELLNIMVVLETAFELLSIL